jgi:hypothetical protein
MKSRPLLGYSNAKTVKGESLGYLTGILYLAPSNTVKGLNLCPLASKGCRKSCLYSAGRGRFNNVQKARVSKTEFFRDDLNGFMAALAVDISKAQRKAQKLGLKLAIRLNGTSDIVWEKIQNNGKNIFQIFPSVQFYDYTKDFRRFANKMPANYHLTFSLSESNLGHALKIIKLGINVAAVFAEVPAEFMGYKVISGDNHDLRFLDGNNGVIVGLTAKGQAKKDLTGFVQRINMLLSEAA